MRIDIKTQCAGKWASVLVSLGMPVSAFSGKHGDCLICHDTRKNARWDKKKEYWICSKCNITRPMDMAIFWTGESFNKTAAIIRGEGLDKMEPIKQTDDTEKNRARIERIRAGLKPIRGTIAHKYLINRGLTVLPAKDCYFHPSVEYWQDGNKTAHPAMVSIFRHINGAGATLHITYLTADGKKADVESPKKILPVVSPIKGSAIQLFRPQDGILAIAEGIETALALHQTEGISVWAAGNASQMDAIFVPDGLDYLYIIADMDASFTGQAAAYALAKRLVGKVKNVRVELMFPGVKGVIDIIPDRGDKFDYLDAIKTWETVA